MQLHLVDVNPILVAAWKESFRPFTEVIVHEGNPLSVAENTVVSPANSFGFMDGGIDADYLAFFGSSIQDKVQQAIQCRPEGHLPVGASLVVPTGHSRIPFLIVAPTMFMPEAVEEDHCYRALRAILRLAGRDQEVGRMVFCPGLATGVGRVPAEVAAREMALAYGDWRKAERAGNHAAS
jgi:O-acetyl-ADP-ribose deacetylase (regulator of RNase III)